MAPTPSEGVSMGLPEVLVPTQSPPGPSLFMSIDSLSLLSTVVGISILGVLFTILALRVLILRAQWRRDLEALVNRDYLYSPRKPPRLYEVMVEWIKPSIDKSSWHSIMPLSVTEPNIPPSSSSPRTSSLPPPELCVVTPNEHAFQVAVMISMPSADGSPTAKDLPEVVFGTYS